MTELFLFPRPARPTGRARAHWRPLLGALLLLLLAAPRLSWAGSCVSVTSLAPASATVGTTIRVFLDSYTIPGSYEVSFNGVVATNATYLPQSGEIRAVVPAGATTGDVVVTDLTTSCTSNGVLFTVQTNQGPTAVSLSNNRVAENAGPNAVVGTLSTTDPQRGRHLHLHVRERPGHHRQRCFQH